MERTSDQYRKFLQEHLADGGFLQSKEWLIFQESTGKKVYTFETQDVIGNSVEHTLPIVGKYWYIPRGPIASKNISQESLRSWASSLIGSAKKQEIRWIRIEPSSQEILDLLAQDDGISLQKAPHDMQPKEVFVIPITGDEESLLSKMKSKTRYNIRLAEKKGVRIFTSRDQKYIDAFCDLIEVTAKRDNIVPHPRKYYQKMFQTIPEDMLKLFVAEYKGEVIAANSVLLFGKYATYLHGASGNAYRQYMAPYLLQWKQILAAREAGCEYYDFGGVKTNGEGNEWAGITRFKTGFSPNQESTSFPGSYDIVVDKNMYLLYNYIQYTKGRLRNIRKFFSI